LKTTTFFSLLLLRVLSSFSVRRFFFFHPPPRSPCFFFLIQSGAVPFVAGVNSLPKQSSPPMDGWHGLSFVLLPPLEAQTCIFQGGVVPLPFTGPPLLYRPLSGTFFFLAEKENFFCIFVFGAEPSQLLSSFPIVRYPFFCPDLSPGRKGSFLFFEVFYQLAIPFSPPFPPL